MTDSVSTYYRGQIRVQTSNVLRRLGTYSNKNLAFANYPSNAGDARATIIWIELEDDAITITDNGNGMVPWMQPQDRNYIDSIMFDPAFKGPMPSLEEIRAALQEATLHSFEWMMRCYGFSSKRLEETEDTSGVMGVGTLAFQMFANKIVITSRPEPALAHAYYGQGLRQGDLVATARLDMPTAEMIQSGDIGFGVEHENEPTLADPFGNELPHGTRVRITELNALGKQLLNVPLLIADLRRRFGEQLRSQMYDLYIVNKLSTAANPGSIIKIEPAAWRGYLLLEGQIECDTGETSLIELYYNPDGVDETVSIIAHGEERGTLQDFAKYPEFKVNPWNLGKISGKVLFPAFKRPEVELWNDEKDTILATKTDERGAFIRAVLKFGPQLRLKMGQLDSTTRRRAEEELATDAGIALREALSEIDFLGESAFGPPSRPSGRGKRSGGTSRTSHALDVKVFDEYTGGVPNVTCELWQWRGLTATMLKSGVTKYFGSLSFGILRVGKRYEVRIIPPKGTTVLGESTSSGEFSYDGKAPPTRIVFRLHTRKPKQGKEPPKVREGTNAKLIIRPFPDPEMPWIQRLGIGTIEINKACEGFRQAENEMTAKDESPMLHYLAVCIAAAYIDFRLHGVNTHDTLLYSTMLYPHLYRQLKERRAERKKGEKRSTTRRKSAVTKSA